MNSIVKTLSLLLAAGTFVLSAQEKNAPQEIDPSAEWLKPEPILFYHQGLVHDGTFYRIGGQMRHGNRAVVYQPVTDGVPAGRVQPVKTSPFAKDEFIVSCGSAEAGNRLYVAGGILGKTGSKDFHTRAVYSAEFLPDGNLGEFRKEADLPEGVKGGGSLQAVGKNLYYIGGFYVRTVYIAPLQENGVIGPWKETSPLPAAMAVRNGACVLDGKIYATGAPQYGTECEKLYCAAPAEDGTIAKWERTADLPSPGYRAVLVADSGKLLYFDGLSGKIYSNTPESDGSLAEDWEEAGTMPVSNVIDFSVTPLGGGSFYYLGGISRSRPPKFPDACVIRLKKD